MDPWLAYCIRLQEAASVELEAARIRLDAATKLVRDAEKQTSANAVPEETP